MIKRLHDFDERQYHRPNDKWIDVPVQTILDDGELKTITVRRRSLRSKRRIFTASCTAFTIGLLMILGSSSNSREFFVPGPLASNHAQILAGEGADRCAACHAAAKESLASWIGCTFSFGQVQGPTQSQLCLNCHDKSLAAETALNPHNLAPNELSQLSKKYEDVAFDAGMGFHPPISGNIIACNACHREHHGSSNDLTAMTDTQCQTCHQESFQGFETDHPEFVSYPLKRRSRIAFDHASHSLQHFPSKNSDFNCNQCHVDDSFQNVKQLASFEQACSSCHHQQILESGEEGLALISLPMIDMNAIEKSNLRIGSWPMAATGDFDGMIPPIMRVMLTADPVAAEVLNRLGPEFDFSDVDPANPEHVKDAVRLVWAIKRLLNELSLDGLYAIRTRLESVIGLEISDEELQKLATNLDESVFQNAVRRWIPSLNVEVANHRFGQPEFDPLSGKVTNGPIRQSNISWWPSEESLQLMIAKEDELLAANPLTGLVKPLDNSPEKRPMPVVHVPDNLPAVSHSPFQPATRQASTNGDSIRIDNAHADPLSNPDLLAVNPLQRGNHQPGTRPNRDGLSKIKIPDPPQTGLINAIQPEPKSPLKPSASVPIDGSKFVPIERPPIVVPSGWFRDDQLFRICYRPSGHADDCIQSWIELVTRAADADTRVETKQLFHKTISLASIGLCRSCHTVDQLPNRSFQVNWQAKYRDPSVRSLTEFAHGPHLIQPNLQDCSHCHTLNPESGNHESFHGVDASKMISNFLPITKDNCASCHQENQTNSGCTQCHNYHVGSRVTGTK